MNKKIISASILSADLTNLADDCEDILKAGADWIHFDVMDYHYVNNLTFGAQICDALIKAGIKAPIDVHLMVDRINPLIKDFAKAGASLISIHPKDGIEAVSQSIDLIHSFGIQAGLVINPDEPIDIVIPWIDKIDLVLVMSVYPGFAAQKFIPESLKKLAQLRGLIDKNSSSMRLSIDGGVSLDTIESCAKAGADTFVSGSALFKSENYKKTIKLIRSKIN